MTKQNLKKLCFRLLLAISLAFSVTAPVAADSVFGSGQNDMLCNSWDDYFAEYDVQGQGGINNCWSCKIFMFLFDSANELAGQTNNTLSGGATSLVIVGGALWLAFTTAAFFGNITGAGDPMEYLSKIGTIMFRVGLGCAFLAGGSSFVFNWVINPVLTSGAQLANDVIISSTENASSILPEELDGTVNAPMGNGVRTALREMILQISSSMAKSQAVAGALRCAHKYWRKVSLGNLLPIPFSWIFNFSFFIPNPLMWLVGAWLGCVFWWISILFSFAMIDVIFRIGLLVGMLPVFIAAWVFPLTKSYAKTAWDMFINTVFVFFATGVLSTFVIIMSENTWGSSSEAANNFISNMQNTAYIDAWDAIFDDKAGKGMTTIMVVLVMAWWGVILAPKSDSVSKKIIGGSFSSSCAVKALKKVIDFAMNFVMAVFTVITFGLGTIMNMFKFIQYIQNSLEKIQNFKKFVNQVREKEEKVKKAEEKLKKIKEKQEKMQTRIEKMQKRMEQVQKVQKVAEKAKKVSDNVSKVAFSGHNDKQDTT